MIVTRVQREFVFKHCLSLSAAFPKNMTTFHEIQEEGSTLCREQMIKLWNYRNLWMNSRSITDPYDITKSDISRTLGIPSR